MTSNLSIVTIVEGVHQIYLGRTSAFLIETDDGPVLIDAGWKWSFGRLKMSLGVLGYIPQDVSLVALTHFHPDHGGGAWNFRKNTDSDIAIHHKDAMIMSGEQAMPEIMTKGVGKFLLNPFLNLLTGRPVNGDITLKGGELLPASLPIEVIHTPGHTDGTVCFHIPSKGVMMVGDALQVKNGLLMPPSRIFSQNWVQAINSLSVLTEYDFDIVCLSHFPHLPSNGKGAMVGLIERIGHEY